MEICKGTAPLELVRLRRLVNASGDRLNVRVDPLRRLIQKRNERLDDLAVRLKLAQSMRKANGTD